MFITHFMNRILLKLKNLQKLEKSAVKRIKLTLTRYARYRETEVF